jgi:S1-C subfamily serine protease
VAGGDLIVKIAGKRMGTQDDVAAAIASRKPGETVEIEYYRGEDLKTVEVKLGKRPSSLNGRGEQGDEELFPDRR